MKTLAMIAHPCLSESRVNKAWANALSECPNVTVRDLTSEYPNMDIDVLLEQELLLEHQRIAFLFPLYWYSSPAILKQWLDLVLQPGFAYGIGGDKLHGKEFVVATAIGSNREGYRAGNHNHFTIDELLRPFQQSVNYIGGRYLPAFCFYKSMVATDEEIAQNAKNLVAYLTNADFNPKRDHERLVVESMEALVSRVL
ncbi:MAG: NAD(P)H-dependent oxidoreductase [Limnobacter sp.]|nr:NAD(P)H-dependent oxidoreductase [Limnobacter sp.]